MNPQEKAKELVSRFRMKHVIAVKNSKGDMVSPYTSGYVEEAARQSTAVQSALLCVNCIIEAIELCFANKYPMTKREYWEEVKQEIKKL